MFQIIAYIKFLLRSTNHRSINSSFVYDLITKCFNNKKKSPIYSKLNSYRRDLLNNHETINVTDFGAGSRVFKSNERAIKDIAKNAGVSNKRAQLLLKLTNYFDFKNALELGTSLGIGTSAIGFDNKEIKITTLEGCPATAKIAQQQFHKYDLNNIHSVVTDFSDYLTTIPKEQLFDFIYFDGNHQKEATLEYFNHLISHTHNNSVLVFDDIHWSKEMEEAWEEIKQHPKVHITVDTFFWGFVFLNTELRQQHFKIRI